MAPHRCDQQRRRGPLPRATTSTGERSSSLGYHSNGYDSVNFSAEVALARVETHPRWSVIIRWAMDRGTRRTGHPRGGAVGTSIQLAAIMGAPGRRRRAPRRASPPLRPAWVHGVGEASRAATAHYRTCPRVPPVYRFVGVAYARNRLLRSSTMDPHERATSVWYRVAGLLRRKELAIEIIEAEIR